jgi:glycosyltransferase involved in cell wall biosynthesis
MITQEGVTGGKAAKRTAAKVVKLSDRALADINVLPTENYDIIVFTDFHWDHINQRPRLLVEQLARYQKVLFVEQPAVHPSVSSDHLRLIRKKDNLTVIKPVLKKLSNLKKLLKKHVASEVIPVGWFCTAAYPFMIDSFRFQKLIYDCDNDHFDIRTRDVNQEAVLMEKSHIILTGSKTVFEEKSLMHRNVHWIPDPVDNISLRKSAGIHPRPRYIVNPERPVIGYCGVIDDRIDYAFVSEVAARMSHATFIFIGPVINPDRKKLPQEPNIHYINLSEYSQITSYLKAFDIAILPYVSEENCFVNTSKVLNYMAANKPVISTPVHDIVRDYSHCISIVKDSREFCRAAERNLQGLQSDIEERWVCYHKILSRNSWEEAAQKIKKLIMS